MKDTIERAAKAYYEAEITSGVFGSKPIAWENSMLRKVRERRIEIMRTALEAAGLLLAPAETPGCQYRVIPGADPSEHGLCIHNATVGPFCKPHADALRELELTPYPVPVGFTK